MGSNLIANRLETIKPELSHRLASMTPDTAASEYSRIVGITLGAIPSRTRAALTEALDVSDVSQINASLNLSMGQYSEAFDRAYFEATDGETADEAQNYFMLARLSSSVEIASNAMSTRDFAEAIYEAIMAAPDPQALPV